MEREPDPARAPEPARWGPGSSESEAFRRCFRRFCYEDARGPREAFRRLWALCCRWLEPDLRSKQQMLELLVVEQLLAALPEAIRARARRQCPGSGEEAVALVARLEKEAGGRRPRVSSPVHSEKQAALGAVWDEADFQPQTQPQVGSRGEAGRLCPGYQGQLNQNREQQPLLEHARPAPWVPAPPEDWNSTDQEGATAPLPAGSQGPVKYVHVARGLSYRKRGLQLPAHRSPHQDVGKGGAGDTVSLGSAVSTTNKTAQLEQRKGLWASRLHSPHSRNVPGGSCITEQPVRAAQVPARSAGKVWREQQQWGLEDEKVAGVHWSYEETKTFLAILRGSRFYETLQACPRNSQVYGAVAEWLRACGFLRTPEQCRTKFKSLQKSYRKVRNGHALEPCAFFEDMDALLNPAAHAAPTGKPEAAAPLVRLKRRGLGTEELATLAGEEGAAEESDGEDAGIEFVRTVGTRGAPVVFQNLSGVHWGYEETKTFLDILRETRFYEALQVCHRKSKLYGVVAEQLRACGFLRTPEQCRTKFKSLQKSYRKVRNGHTLEPCAFYKEMDALVNARAPVPSTSTPGPGGEDAATEPQDPAGWEPEGALRTAVVEDSGSERMSEEDLVQESEFWGPPGPLPSPAGFDIGGSIKEDAGPVRYKDVVQPRALLEKPTRGVAHNTDPGRYPKRESVSGRQWENLHDSGKALVHQRPFPGRRPCRPLKYGDSLGRGARLACRVAHQKENPCKCSICGKCFGRRGFPRHLKTHTGEKPYACAECGRSFVSSSLFSAHRRARAGESPFKCVDCEKTSACARLREHRRVHAVDRPYACAPCGRRFSRSSVLGRHREAHVRDRLLPHPTPMPTPEHPQKGRLGGSGKVDGLCTS